MHDRPKSQKKLFGAIFSSLENKYESATATAVRVFVDEAECMLRDANTENEIFLDAQPTKDLRTDVFNQVRAYYLIERVWRSRPPEQHFLERLHAAVYGLDASSISYRQGNHVEDYGEEITIPASEIPDLLAVLNTRIRAADGLIDSSLDDQARFLASLFADIIKVHPFPDGNGRAARMSVQYCLRRWGREFLVIPKVRNDSSWRHALSSATDGDYDALSEFFRRRIGA